jgi:hypothetical protein
MVKDLFATLQKTLTSLVTNHQTTENCTRVSKELMLEIKNRPSDRPAVFIHQFSFV